MARQPHLDRVWDVIELVGVCMLTTRFAGGLRARPLQSRPDRYAGIIWFVTDLLACRSYDRLAAFRIRSSPFRPDARHAEV
jgi:hypothetical protein